MKESRNRTRMLYKRNLFNAAAFLCFLLILIGIVGDEINIYYGRMIIGTFIGVVLSILRPFFENNFPLDNKRKLFISIFIGLLVFLFVVIGKNKEDLFVLLSLFVSYFLVTGTYLYFLQRKNEKQKS